MNKESKQYLKIKLEGYRACILKIPRKNNWYEWVRSNTPDSLAWYDGWDLAKKDLKI